MKLLDRSAGMARVLLLMALAPLSVAVGLFLFRSAAVTFLLFHGCVCLGIPAADMAVNRPPPGEFLRRTGLMAPGRHLLHSLPAGLLMFTAVYLFFALFRGGIWDPEAISSALERWGALPADPVPFVSMMVFGNAVLEEFFWRGYVLMKLHEVTGAGRTVLLSSAFYASYHVMTTGVLFSLPYAAVSTASIFAAGVFWARARLRTGSLVFPMVTHLAVDLAIMLAYLKYIR